MKDKYVFLIGFIFGILVTIRSHLALYNSPDLYDPKTQGALAFMPIFAIITGLSGVGINRLIRRRNSKNS